MKIFLTTALLAAGLTITLPANAETRPVEDTWNLTDLYPTLADWQQAKQDLTVQIDGIDQCQGNLGKDAKTLLKCSVMIADLSKAFARWAIYASLEADVDTREAAPQERRQEARLLGNKFSQKLSFLNPEILSVGEKLHGFFASEDGLGIYHQGIRDILRQAEHTLDEAGEQLLAASSLVQGAPANIYRTLANSELPWSTITLSDGTEARLDSAGYTRYRGVDNRADRKLVFDNFWPTWGNFKRTLGTTLSAQVQAHIFSAQTRNYANPMAAALAAGNIPEKVYHTLISETNANLDTLHRYFRLRARMLDINDMGYHDIYPSLVSLEKDFSIEVGKQLTLEAMKPLGKGYQEVMVTGFNRRWMELDYMLKRTESDDEKLYYLGSALEILRGTFYRQAMFAEFELAIHEKASAGEALSGDSLTALYADILKRYHGHEQGVVNIAANVTVEWAYIPHFYYNFYVYQYATSLAASSLLAESVLNGAPSAVDNYLELLKAGGSDYPYDLLLAAGVDLATPEPYRAVVKRMNGIMDEIESILDRQPATAEDNRAH